MRRLGWTLAVLLLTAAPSHADDASDIRDVISRQLDAFRSNDGSAAYGFAAPNIRRLFPSPGIFMQMVETGYGPVFRSSNATFGTLQPEGSGWRQDVFLSGRDGQSWIATYTLERQPDGAFRITGCQIRRGSDVST